MSSMRSLLQSGLICGLIPLIVWSGLPQSVCACRAAGERCACPAADDEEAGRDTCDLPCCAHHKPTSRRRRSSADAQDTLAVRHCRCQVVSTAPVSDPRERSADGVSPLDQAALLPVALEVIASAPRAAVHPSSRSLPPLDRLSAFCVLRV